MGERVAFNLFPIIRVLAPLVGPDTIAKRLTTVLTILVALMVFAKLPATLIDVNATTALMDLIVNWMSNQLFYLCNQTIKQTKRVNDRKKSAIRQKHILYYEKTKFKGKTVIIELFFRYKH